MKYKEIFLKRTRQVRGRAVNFNIDLVKLPNQKNGVREYLDHPGAVAVIPLLDQRRMILVRQYRHPVRQVTWEIPAGKLHRNENPLSCVKRELAEETGYRARKIKKILSYWPTAAFSNEVIHIYIATGLTPGDINLDDDEFVTWAAWPIAKAISAIRRGKIKDSKTIIGILALQSLLEN